MIKKILILLVLSFSIMNSYADEQRRVKLNDDKHSKEIIEVANFNIFLELTEIEENGSARINVELENLDESKGLSLFERVYDEKTLKKMIPEHERVEELLKTINKNIFNGILSRSDTNKIFLFDQLNYNIKLYSLNK